MDLAFLYEALLTIIPGIPLTLKLAVTSVGLGIFIALPLALMRLSGIAVLDWFSRIYTFVFRSTPLLVQIFIIYYGLGQFREIRTSMLWPVLRDPYWCAIIALTLNTAAYASEIIRGGLTSVPAGQIEAARAVGMNRLTAFRRIIVPQAVRQALLLLDRLLGAVSALSLAALTLPFVDLKVRFGVSQPIVWSCAVGLVSLAAGGLLWPRTREPVIKLWKLAEGHRLVLSGLFALSILMHGLFALAVHWAGRGLGLPITFADCCLAVAGGMLLMVVPISIAGLGPAEVGATGLFMALGYEPTIAITAGALPYLLRLTGAIQGAGLELFEGGNKVFTATRQLMKRSRLPDSN